MSGRTFVLLCSVVMILLFSGCEKKNEVFVLQQFESEVVIAGENNIQYKGTADFDGIGTVSVSLNYPETMKGATVISSQDSTSYRLQDMSFDVGNNNAVYILRNILSDMKKRTFFIGQINTVSQSDIKYNVTFDEQYKTISKIETSEYVYTFLKK